MNQPDNQSSPRSALTPGRQLELEMAMRHFFELAAADQLRAFDQMRNFLDAAAPAKTKTDRAAAEQAAAVDALALVADHLDLSPGKAPTVTQFDRACRELDLPWTRSRVIRAWGLWRAACAAFRGEVVPLTARQLAYRRRFSGQQPRYQAPVSAVRRWLEGDPPALGLKDYDAWAREQNKCLGPDDLLFPVAITVRRHLRLTWGDVLRVARREVELDDLPPHKERRREDSTDGPDDLISISTVMKVLGVSHSEAHSRTCEPGFPIPVAVFGTTRAWLRGDIEAFAAGTPFPARRENELRDRYLDTHQLAALVGLSPKTMKQQSKATSPPATGRVAATKYWLRADVDHWIAAHHALVSKRLKQQVSRPRTDVERKKLVALSDLEVILGLSPDQSAALVAEHGFPDPIAHIGPTPIWLRCAVDAYLTGQPPIERLSGTDDVIGSRELAAMSGLSLTSVRHLRGVPPPAGKAGRRHYWWRSDIEPWLVERTR